jgi:hypothetical protein
MVNASHPGLRLALSLDAFDPRLFRIGAPITNADQR